MSIEQVKIGRWLIEVDRAATQAAYVKEQPINACGCDYCENYFVACVSGKAHSPALAALFQRLGIAPEKEAEVYTFYANQEKTQVYYGGFYHLVGQMTCIDEGSGYSSLDDHFKIAFTDKCSLLSEGFPQPALEIAFVGFIPWLLDKKRDPLDPLVLPQGDEEKNDVDHF